MHAMEFLIMFAKDFILHTSLDEIYKKKKLIKLLKRKF